MRRTLNITVRSLSAVYGSLYVAVYLSLYVCVCVCVCVTVLYGVNRL